MLNVRQDRSRQGHHYWEAWPRSSPSSTRAPETDKSWPIIEPGSLWWEATTLAKSYWNSCLIPIKTYTWAHDMILTAPGCTPNSTCKSSDQALASVHAQCQARQIMSGSFPSSTRAPDTEPSRWEAPFLSKSYSNSFLIAMQNIYMGSRQYVTCLFCNVR